MSNTMKSTGKTVDEAIREALLRMGLRREEVNVKVIQEARGGFLGMGRREAVVEVEKKPGSRTQRDDRASRSGRQDRDGGRSARGRGGRRRSDADGEDRGKKRESSRRGGRGRGRGRRADADAGGQEAARESRDQPAASENGSGDDQDQKSSRSRRRGRRGRGRRRSGARVDESVNQREEGRQESRRGGGENGREQRREERAESSRRDAGASAQPEMTERREAHEATSGGGDRPQSGEGAPRNEAVEASAAPAPDPAPAAIVADVKANERVEPLVEESRADEVDLLRRTATDLMVKSGFQARVEVIEGDYHKVKMVVDDRSAGVLIGRQGSTVDAVEHLIERVVTHTVGERVKFNLDINNYRLRREDGLLGQTRRAIQEARDSGEPVSMDPAGGRERRIVHLEVAGDDELVTYTEIDDDGKHVVICRPEQVPDEYRDPELHGPPPASDGSSSDAPVGGSPDAGDESRAAEANADTAERAEGATAGDEEADEAQRRDH